MKLFSRIRYFLSPSYTSEQRELVQHLLRNNGAEEAETVRDATHVVTNSHRFEGWQEVQQPGAAVVTFKWIERSVLLGKLQPTQYYSADPAMIFSGVLACATNLPSQDLEVLSAGILALGGQWRTGLTKETTHLFAITNTSPKYTTALHFQEQTHIRVVLPHWFDDSVRLGVGSLSTAPYEWPDPPLLRRVNPLNDKTKKAMAIEVDAMKRSLYSTAIKEGDVHPVWGGRKVLLSANLGLSEGRREAVEVGIQRAGGHLVRVTDDVDGIEDCDIYITRWREGRAYIRAFRLHKTIGTLAWVYHVQSTGTITRPLDQLLHYPIPRSDIEGFSQHEITVTNYTGDAREYLKKLITTMGAKFTPSMSGKNTVLIAASKEGTKADKALSWSIPVVNHTWLEDCFVRWRNLTPATDKYLLFPEGLDFSTILGERGVGMGKLIEEEVEELEEEERERELSAAASATAKPHVEMGVDDGHPAAMDVDNKDEEAPPGTAASANEVQALFDGDGDALMVDQEDQERENLEFEDVEHVLEVDTPPSAREQEEDEDEPPLPPPKKRITKTKGKALKEVAQVESDTEDEEVVRSPTKASNGRAKAQRWTKSFEEEQEEEEQAPPTSKKRKDKALIEVKKTKTKRAPRSETEEDEDEESGGHSPSEDEVQPSKKRKTKTPVRKPAASSSSAKTKSATVSPSKKANRAPPTTSEYEDDDDEDEVVQNIKPRTRLSDRRGPGSDDDDEDDAEVAVRRSPLRSRRGGATMGTRKGRTSGVSTRPNNGDDEDVEEIEEEEEEDPAPKSKAKARMAMKGKGKAKAVMGEAQDEEDEDEEPISSRRISTTSKTKSTAKSVPNPSLKSTSPSKRTKLPSPPPLNESDSEDDPPESIFAIISAGSKTKTKPKAAARDVAKASSSSTADNAHVNHSAKRGAAPSSVLKPTFELGGKGKGKAAVAAAEDEDEDESDQEKREAKKQSLAKRKSLTTVEVQVPQKSLSKAAPKASGNGKRKAAISAAEAEDEEEETAHKNQEKKGKSKKQPLAKRKSLTTVEVQVPQRSPSKVAPKATTASAAEAKAKAKSKLTAPAPAPAAPAASSSSHRQPVPAPAATNVDAPVSSTAQAPARRAAATKATAKLHDEIMPDVMQFESQMRKSRKSGGGVAGFVVHGDTVPDPKQSETTAAGKRRKRASEGAGGANGSGQGEEEEEDGEMGSEKGRKRVKANEGLSAKSVKNQSSLASSSSTGLVGGDAARKPIYLATTQGTLSEDVIKTLTKLGVTMTNKASECTHLLASGIVRTEKFLCAIAVGAHILKRDWAIESAKANKLLSEKKYVLKDDKNKYGLNLEESLGRARKGKLMEGKTFYVAGKSVSNSFALLKTVVSACGGQIKDVQKLTHRVLAAGPERYAISSQEDVAVWRQLVTEQETPVYSVELILSGALHQKLDLDAYKLDVPES